jgi:lysozyme
MASRFRKAGIGVTAAGAMAISLVGGFEGYSAIAYKDVVGVWTACYGETKGIRAGMKFTKEQCDDKFIQSLVEHEDGMRKCLKNPDSIPDKPYISFISLTYNIGTGGFCKGNMPKLINAGKIKEACNYLLNYNKAGGIVWKGLVKRREKEKAFCLSGI